MEFIQANLLEIVIVTILAIIAIVYVIWQIRKKRLRGFVVEAIVQAEEKYLKGENTEKMDFVVSTLQTVIPMPFKIFITKDNLQSFAQNIFDEIKIALDHKK